MHYEALGDVNEECVQFLALLLIGNDVKPLLLG